MRKIRCIYFCLSLSFLLSGCSDSFDVLQASMEVELNKQRPSFESLVQLIEKQRSHDLYPADLTFLQSDEIPTPRLPSNRTTWQTQPCKYEVARDHSFYRVMCDISDVDDYNLYAATSYFSWTQHWETSWDPEPFILLESKYYGHEYQASHSMGSLDLAVSVLMDRAKNDAHVCRNFWGEWVLDALGKSQEVGSTIPTVQEAGEKLYYPAHDGAYAFLIEDRVYRPMKKPLKIVVGVYKFNSPQEGWTQLRTCDASPDASVSS